LTQASAMVELEVERMCGMWLSEEWSWFEALNALSKGEQEYRHWDFSSPEDAYTLKMGGQ